MDELTTKIDFYDHRRGVQDVSLDEVFRAFGVRAIRLLMSPQGVMR